MFYCDFCGKKNQWPITGAKSQGPCEICGTRADCSDVQSRDLPKPPKKKIVLRPKVMAFSQAMEQILRQNDWKGGWKEDSLTDLVDRIWDEIREMEGALALYHKNYARPQDVQKELVDIANFCMMAWDCIKTLKAVEAE